VLYAIVVMLERTTGVVRWINIDALDLAGEFLFECFESEKVVAEDETVIEPIVVGDTVLRVVRFVRILQQNPRLQLRPVLFPDPGEFEFGSNIHGD
jgi:hypothetical protein